SLIALNSLAKSSLPRAALCNGDSLLEQVAEAAESGQRYHPAIDELRQMAGITPAASDAKPTDLLILELKKVHGVVDQRIEGGMLVMADLLRYRQRIEWYAREDLLAFIEREE